MSEPKGASGPQFRADRPVEQEAVRTTIVGGRPPGSGQRVGDIPRGIEVLVKKAAVDPQFRELLLDRRAEAAESIELRLDPAEAMMLAAAPRAQLEAIIARTSVPEEHRRAFLGHAAAAMLAAIGVATAGCGKETPTKGIRPDEIPITGDRPDRPPQHPERVEPSQGTRPRPPERPERVEPTKGISPDRPPWIDPPEHQSPQPQSGDKSPHSKANPNEAKP